MVYRSMHRLTGARSPDFDDLVQSAAEQVTRSLPSFDQRSDLRTWIFAVCYRVLLRQRRWYRRWAARFSIGLDQHDPASDAPLPSRALETREAAEQLQAALDAMTDRYRAVVVLRDIEEHSIAEIAEIVGAGELTVRSRLRDGRKQLSQLLRARSAAEWIRE